MKNVLKYYYDLYSEDIHLIGENYFFNVDDACYVFYQYDGSLEKLKKIYEIYLTLIQKSIYTHQIILNKFNNILTVFNNKQYILLKIPHNYDDEISLNEIIYFGNITNGIEHNVMWKNLWSNKIDYFEYQLSHVGKKYPLIRDSFSYYAGILENGIILCNEIKINRGAISHHRINSNLNILEFYNPLNYVIDVKVRDSSEYFKDQLLNSNDIFESVVKYINSSKLNNDEIYLFFVRMFYPTFYFDCYEKIIAGEVDEAKIKEVINITSNYENLLRNLYKYLKKYISIPEIEWLN